MEVRRPAPRRTNNKKRKVRLQPGQSKFDAWLEKMKEEKRSLSFHFAIPPLVDDPDGLQADCTVIEVDRYMLFLEFQDGQCWWVAKGTITAVSWTI